MVECGKRLRFARKPRKTVRVRRECVGQNLQCNVTIELGIARPIHRPHAALADESGDLVIAQACAGCQSHGRVIIRVDSQHATGFQPPTRRPRYNRAGGKPTKPLHALRGGEPGGVFGR